MSKLIEKQGGIASVRSLQGTVYKADDEVKHDLKRIAETGADWFIFTTGIGFQTLIEQAEEIGIKDDFLLQIKNANVASRGYKTAAALKKFRIDTVVSDDDGTTKGLIRQLEKIDFSRKKCSCSASW